MKQQPCSCLSESLQLCALVTALSEASEDGAEEGNETPEMSLLFAVPKDVYFNTPL